MSWNPWWNDNNTGHNYNFYSPNNWMKKMNDYNGMIREFMNDPEVSKRISNGEKVIAKITKNNKVYRVIIEEITSENEKISIEFEDEAPDKHPDFTE